jgi:glycerol kinase
MLKKQGDSVNPNAHLYLAIDQGGHASRASLYEAKGSLIATATVPVHTYHPAPDQVEHDPEEMVASVQTAITDALRSAGSSTIAAAGLATQRSSVVCWDKISGAALSPVLSWQDRRTAGWLRQLASQAPEIQHRTGLPLSPHYGAGKLRWCLDHLPAVQDAWRERRLACGPLASFLTYHLTEERTLSADPANASRTLLWNLGSGDWDPVLAGLFGVPIDALPPCVATHHAWGHINIGKQRIPLTIVTGDQSAALFATGEPTSGKVMINLGTGAFLQQSLSHRPAVSRLLTSLAYQDQMRRIYALEGTVNGAGSALSWVSTQLKLDEKEITHHLPNWLKEMANPPLFLNGVAGLGTPYLTPLFASRFSGNGSEPEKCVAVIESIVFLLQVNLEEMTRNIGPATSLVISGGLSQLDGLCQRLADLSHTPLFRLADREATAQGLMRLLTGTPQADSDKTAGTSFVPQANPSLETRYHLWRKALEAALAEQA